MRADGRDVAQSLIDAPFGPSTIAAAARIWRKHVIGGRRAGRSLPGDRYLEVAYEDLVVDPEHILRRVCAFLGLPFDPHMLEYVRRADAVLAGTIHPKAHANVRRPPTVGLRDWRVSMEPRAVGVFDTVAADVLVSFGYEPVHHVPTFLHRLETRRQIALGRAGTLTRAFARRSIGAMNRLRPGHGSYGRTCPRAGAD